MKVSEMREKLGEILEIYGDLDIISDRTNLLEDIQYLIVSNKNFTLYCEIVLQNE